MNRYIFDCPRGCTSRLGNVTRLAESVEQARHIVVNCKTCNMPLKIRGCYVGTHERVTAQAS